MATKRESRDHSLKNLENIKDFSTRFLDALIIRNGKLCFNEKQKLQNLIQLLSDESILDSDLEDVTEDHKKQGKLSGKQKRGNATRKMQTGSNIEGLATKLVNLDGLEGLGDITSDDEEEDEQSLSLTEQLLRKNNYEIFLDTIATRIQKVYKGFEARRSYKILRNRESIKIFEKGFVQEGEHIFFLLMKRIADGRVSAYCVNLSTDQFFDPIIISKHRMNPLDIFANIHIDIDNCFIIFDDFFSESSYEVEKIKSVDPLEQKKFEFFLRTYISNLPEPVIRRVFRRETRYSLIAKRTAILVRNEGKQHIFNLLFFFSHESQTIEIVVFKMDERKSVYSKIYHNNGPKLTLLIIAKSLYTDSKLIETERDQFSVIFPSVDVSLYSEDYNDVKVRGILTIQRRFRFLKMKASLRYSTDILDFKIEVFYLKNIEKIILKIYKIKPDPERYPESIKNSPKMKFFNSLDEGQIYQCLNLSFHEIHHPYFTLDDLQVSKLINYILVSKLHFELFFFLEIFYRNEILEAIKERSPDKILPSLIAEIKAQNNPISRSNFKSTNSNQSKPNFRVPDLVWQSDSFFSGDKDNITKDNFTRGTQSKSRRRTLESAKNRRHTEDSRSDSEDIAPSLDYQFGNKNNLSLEMSVDDFQQKLKKFQYEQIDEEDSRNFSVESKLNKSDGQHYTAFKRHKSMKAKLFAYVRFNALRRQQRLKTYDSLKNTKKSSVSQRLSLRGPQDELEFQLKEMIQASQGSDIKKGSGRVLRTDRKTPISRSQKSDVLLSEENMNSSQLDSDGLSQEFMPKRLKSPVVDGKFQQESLKSFSQNDQLSEESENPEERIEHKMTLPKNRQHRGSIISEQSFSVKNSVKNPSVRPIKKDQSIRIKVVRQIESSRKSIISKRSYQGMQFDEISGKKIMFNDVLRGQKPKTSLKSTEKDFVIHKKKPTLDFLKSGSRGMLSEDHLDSKGDSSSNGFFFKK